MPRPYNNGRSYYLTGAKDATGLFRQEAAAWLAGKRYVNAEFMYKPRPSREREQIVFDYTLRSRLEQLTLKMPCCSFVTDKRH
ncbi:MAG: hypothetical protein R3E39_04430 [Anaerolineae bacterium]